MQPGALAGIRVLDFTRVLAGPSATQILGDLGADVIKIEEPSEGDEQRFDRGTSKIGDTPTGFIAFNRNKRSIGVNLKTDPGREIVWKLIDSADVVVHNFRPGVMERLGLGYAEVAERYPSIVYCGISGFSAQGPRATRAANDIVIQASSGLMSITGYPDMPPVRTVNYPSDLTGGVYAATGVLAALFHRERTGEGQLVEVSMMGAVLSTMGRFYGEYLVGGHVPKQLGSGQELGCPNGAFPAKDGWVAIASSSNDRWRRTAQALGIGHLADDPRFATREARLANRAETDRVVSEETAKYTRAELEAKLAEYGLSANPVLTLPEVAEHPDFGEHFVEVPVNGEGVSRNVAPALTLSKTPTAVHKGVPRLGEHGLEILLEVGYSGDEAQELLEGASAAMEHSVK